MFSCLKLISQGCFEVLFAAAWVAVGFAAIRWIQQGRPEYRMSVWAFLFWGMVFWRLTVRIFAFRYAIGLTIPAAVLAAYLPLFDGWPHEWMRRFFHGLLMLGVGGLAVIILIRVATTPTEENDFEQFGKMFRMLCPEAKQLAVLDSGRHGRRVLYALKLPRRPLLYQYAAPGVFAAKLEKCLETADYILVITVRKDAETRRKILERYQLPMHTINSGRHWGFLLDNRNAYHWGRAHEKRTASPKGNVFSLDFEKPEFLKVVPGSNLDWFKKKQYRFFENRMFFFSPELRLVKHGDLKQENIATSELKLTRKSANESVIDGEYSCHVKTSEYYTFNAVSVKCGKTYQFGVDFRGKAESRLIFQALLINPQGKFETHRLGSFKILESGKTLHGEFDCDTGSLQAKNGEFLLQLVVSGDFEFDNVNVFER